MKDKRLGKLNRHFQIMINGRKCRILNYCVNEYTITLKTKMSNDTFYICRDSENYITIETETEKVVYTVAGRYTALHSPTMHEYSYKLCGVQRYPKEKG